MYKQFNLQEIVERIIRTDGILSRYINPKPKVYRTLMKAIPLKSLSKETNLDPKEFEVQKALGTLPMKTFTIAQPIKLDISIDLVITIEATNAKSALTEFEQRIKDHTTLLELVKKTLNDMTNTYRTEENLVIPRAVAHAGKTLDLNEVLIIRVKDDEE